PCYRGVESEVPLPTNEDLQPFVAMIAQAQGQVQQAQGQNQPDCLKTLQSAQATWSNARNGIEQIALRDYSPTGQVMLRAEMERIGASCAAAVAAMGGMGGDAQQIVPFRAFFSQWLAHQLGAVQSNLRDLPHDPPPPVAPSAPPPRETSSITSALTASVSDM